MFDFKTETCQYLTYGLLTVLTIDTTSNDRGTGLKCDRMNGYPRGERTVAKNGDMYRSREGGG